MPARVPPPLGTVELEEEPRAPLLDLSVVAWRYDSLVRAGYSVEQATLLASRGDIDLHVAVALLGSGCPVELAVAILT